MQVLDLIFRVEDIVGKVADLQMKETDTEIRIELAADVLFDFDKVDIRKDAACPHCHSAFSLIDPAAVEQALQGYAKASKAPASPADKATDIGDALIMLERDRQRALRERQAERGRLFTADASS